MRLEEHALALLKAYDFAREGVIWIALLLLIKGHTDLQAQITLLQMQEAKLASAIAGLSNGPPLPASVNTVTWPGDGLGNLVISGDLKVMGCMLWQQETGLFQNSCSVLTSLVYDCIHGVPFELVASPSSAALPNAPSSSGKMIVSPVCNCEPHWTGPFCDIHDCYGRGVYELNTGLCECMVAGYTASSMCKDRIRPIAGCNLDLPIPPGESNCYGQCVDGQCICTKPGQLGRRCMQCAYPEISSTNCPGRTNWGVEYIDAMDEFAVCGGGYEFSSSDFVVMRGMTCQSPNCEEFRAQRTRCCNPLALENSINSSKYTTTCPNWQLWTFNRLDFGAGSIFNEQYRLRYLQILRDHNGAGCNNSDTRQPTEDCLRRSYNTVQTSDWPLLELDRRPMHGYVIYLNGQSLGLKGSSLTPSSKLIPSLWSTTNTTVYLQGTGVYPVLDSSPIQRTQLYFIVVYLYPYVYCLSERDADKLAQLVLSGMYSGTGPISQMYWINLLDQPGIFLPMHGYCGQFNVDGHKFRRVGSLGGGIFPGSRSGGGYWWPLDQGTVLAATS